MPAVDAARKMTGICGWAKLSRTQEATATTLSRLERDFGALRPGFVSSSGASFALAAGGAGVRCLNVGDAIVILAGRPHWNGHPVSPDASEALRGVLDGYRASGVDAMRSLGGTFALSIVLDGGREVFLAVDRMGVASLTYRATGDGLVFGSTSDLVNSCIDSRPEINLQSLYNYIFLHMVPGPATIFRDQFRIPPGGFVRLKDGKIDSGRYWRMRYEEPASYDIRDLKAEFRELLDRGVASFINGRATGTFLSGGTDSSTIAGLLAKVSGRPARAYSIGFEAEGYDEMEYARIAARHFAVDHHEYYVTPDDVLALAPRLAEYCDQPFGNASAVPTYYCARLARADGIELLLGGDGGDELFGGNERYAMQAILSWYDRVPRLLRKGLIEPVLFGIPGAGRVPLLRKGRGYVTQASEYVPDRLHAHNMLRRNPLESVFTGEFLRRIDPAVPSNLFREVYDAADAQTSLNRTLAVDLQFTLADNDLYKVSRMCELAGVDVGYPMLSDELVAFSARLPTRLKLKGTTLRYFFKEALKDFLPREIIRKHKHGFGLPIGAWMRSHAPLKETIYDAVHALGARGIVQPSFISKVMSEHQSGHAAYWGSQIWVLSQLELWLRKRGGAAGISLL